MHGESPALADPPDVGVDDHTGDAEDPAEDDVRGLAPHAVELQQFVHCLRHDAAELLLECSGHPRDGPRLLMVEARRFDVTFKFGQFRRGEIRRGPVPGEQGRGDPVDLRVGALRRQDRRNEQLQRVAVPERQAGDGIPFAEEDGDLRGTPPKLGGCLAGGKTVGPIGRHRRRGIR